MVPAPPQEGPVRAVAVLPARLGSTRLARKVLLAETGTPLFVHAARNAARCADLVRVVVATDSEEVRAAGVDAGVEVVLTSPEHSSGTDRVHEALQGLGEEFQVVVNVQADEPDVDPLDLAGLVGLFVDAEVQAATLATPIRESSELYSPTTVKVVRDDRGDALYFSRSPIPSREHARPSADRSPELRHLGVYAYRPKALARFCALPEGRLEAIENLEQLRWLEAGERMRVLDARHAPRGIDTRADYDEFVSRMGAAKAPGTQQQ